MEQKKGERVISDQTILCPIYRRPGFDAFSGCPGGGFPEPRYIYSASAFLAHDIFDLLILDGGAFLWSVDYLGGGKGTDYLAAYEAGKLFGPKMTGRTVDWQTAMEILLSGLREYYCWLSRLYYLLPLAQQFFLTHDEVWARQWAEHFDSWYHHSAVSSRSAWENWKRVWMATAIYRLKKRLSPSFINAIKRNVQGHNVKNLSWRDMQLSWRLLVLIHSVFLLNESCSITEEIWRSIYQAIEEHAKSIYREAAMEMRLSVGHGNHFLHKGVALLYVGTLYPELDKSGDYLELGRKIVRYHSMKETSHDGINVENSPSYSHFIVRLHLEASLLLEANNRRPISGLNDIIKKQYAFLLQCETPSGLTPAINDSYHLDAAKDRSIVSSMVPTMAWGSQESHFYVESNFAVLRASRFTLMVDGADTNLQHIHSGKPNILFFSGRFPVLVDAGCCNYDRKERKGWYISSNAHNIVMVEPVSGSYTEEFKGLGAVKMFSVDEGPDTISISMSRRSRAGPVRYFWERRVILGDAGLDIADHVHCDRTARIIVLFHFAPGSIIGKSVDGQYRLENIDWQMTLGQEVSHAHRIILRTCSVFNEENHEVIAPEMQTQCEGRDIHITTSMRF